MKTIGIFDTTNFLDFPIGGQLTSIKYFLKYISESQNKSLDNFVLIGITKNADDTLGKVKKINFQDFSVNFLPIHYVQENENNPGDSLRKQYFKSLIKFRKEIKQLNIDINYIQTLEAFLPLYLFNKGKKVIFSHGNFFDILPYLRFGTKSRVIKKILKIYLFFVLKKSDKIFVLDEKTKVDYSRYTKGNNVIVVENSIDNEQFNKRNYKKEIGKTHGCNLLFVGRLSKNKGIEDIILSLKELNSDEVTLSIVGLGEEYNNLLKVIEENNMGCFVKLLGKKSTDELIDIYLKNDILIMNSFTEGTPMVILESLASGMPVISTPVGNIPHLIKEGVNGEFTDGTPKSIANKIVKIQKEINQYKKNCLRSSNRFSYKKVNRRIYEELIN